MMSDEVAAVQLVAERAHAARGVCEIQYQWLLMFQNVRVVEGVL